MRLNLDDSAPDEDPRSRREPAGARFGMWGPCYFALWVNAVALAAMVYAGRDPRSCLIDPALELALWAAMLAFLAFVACQGRIALHDLLITLTLRDRFLLGLFTFVPVVLPATLRGPRVVPDGLLWAVPLMLLLAVTPALTRRLLALTLLGAWGAAGRLDGEAGLALTLAFGLTWLAALGATHFAHTGDPHGLGGTWPVRKVAGNALLTSIPAAIAAVLAWLAWPKPAPPPPGPLRPGPPPDPARLIARLDPMERAQFIYWGAATIVVTLLAVVFLYFVRRWLLRRSARAVAMKLIPGQLAQVEYAREAPKAEEKPRLGGLRGRIVALWARWATAAGQTCTPRAPGETAAAYAARLDSLAEPPAALTALLEKAHYSQAEPRKEDVETMARLVQEELTKLKQSQSRSQP